MIHRTPQRHAWLAAAAIACVFVSFPLAGMPIRSGFFRSTDGVQLHYLEAGAGPTLVFVPGWTMPAEIWEPQISYFSERFHVVAFDPRGQGQSEVARGGYTAERRARDIGELIERVAKARRVVLVGWSLGVLECLTYIDRNGTARLSALVLVDNSIGEGRPPTGSGRSNFFSRLRKRRRSTTEQFVRSMYRRPPSAPYVQRIVNASLRMPTEAAVALLRYPYPREHWKEIVYRTDIPILYAVTPRLSVQAESLKKNRPEAWIRVFPDAGHALFVDEPEEFNKLLDEFLEASHRE